jgi:hypothetical protein
VQGVRGLAVLLEQEVSKREREGEAVEVAKGMDGCVEIWTMLGEGKACEERRSRNNGPITSFITVTCASVEEKKEH